MNNNFNFPFIFTFTTIVGLFIDLSQFFLLGTLFIPFLLCIYCALLFYDLRTTPLTIITLLLCLESFCFYSKIFLPLLYLIPIAGLGLLIKKNFYPSFLHIIIFILWCAVAHIYIVENLLLGIVKESTYTLIQICVIILVEICFSLTIKYWGMLDNRA
jgi:hypothetical protein